MKNKKLKICHLFHRFKQKMMPFHAPVQIGDTVYAILDDGVSFEVVAWKVKGIAKLSDGWYALDRDLEMYKIGEPFCILSRKEAISRKHLHEKYKRMNEEYKLPW